MPSLLPLAILLLVLSGGAYIAYQIYAWSNELADRGKASMEKKHNMSFTKDGGLRVGVKDMDAEGYADRTQNVLVNVWNNANPGAPGAQPKKSSRWGWGSSSQPPMQEQIRPTTRTASQQASSTGLQAPAASQKRSASPVPGSFD